MLIRILSDLHLSINKDYPLSLGDKDIYTLIAGDLGPDYEENEKWIRKNIKRGAFVSGNHDPYNSDKIPLEDVKKFYHEKFPLDSDITYFDYDVGVISKEIGENLLLVADVLYTDYRLPCFENDHKRKKSELVEFNMSRALPRFSGTYMNDFGFFTRNGTYEKSEFEMQGKYVPSDLYYLRPKNYLEHFNSAFSEIRRIVRENEDKEIILMTHHCLSPRCFGPFMNKSSLGASYASDKTDWIRKHRNIKLIVSGHIHNEMNFTIGSTRYVMNPLGYCSHFQYVRKDENGKNVYWSPDFFVDTENWTVRKDDFYPKKWLKMVNF